MVVWGGVVGWCIVVVCGVVWFGASAVLPTSIGRVVSMYTTVVMGRLSTL